MSEPPSGVEAVERLKRTRLLGERVVYRTRGGGAGRQAAGDEQGTEPMIAQPVGFDEAAWEALRTEVEGCTACDLHATRTRAVFGSGTPHTRLVVIGEAPGFHEDQQGEAFVGRAGQLLTKILQAIGFEREHVFITNILKSRPPGNADPLPHQVAACEPYLIRQLALIEPAAILTLGLHAVHTLLRKDGPMKALRGQVYEYSGIPVVATYHPAALLRNSSLKRPTWEDVQLLRRVYDENLAARGEITEQQERRR